MNFSKFSHKVTELAGNKWTFLCALVIIVVWGICGPLFHYSTTWQLVINTMTTIITFLMVFIIQHAQNKDTKAIQEKLDELIKSIDKADNNKIGIEDILD